jgi:Flp pilus assembly secretin CpaC
MRQTRPISRTRLISNLAALAALGFWIGLSAPATAQSNGGYESGGLPVVPQRAPRAAQGKGADEQWGTARNPKDKPLASLIETPQGTDATLEVVVGQGRLLTLKKPIAGAGRTAFIAVGDPRVVDFEVLPNPQMIRLTGKRAGLTDLSITSADGETFSFDVHVIYDLKLLTAYLKQTLKCFIQSETNAALR